MHDWSEKDVDWQGIDNAAYYIGCFITRWGRIGVMQTKEKFGTVRVYCHLGFSCFHGLIWPWHHWIHTWWPYKLDLTISRLIDRCVNYVLLPWQRLVYRQAYKNAIKKWPHLKEEILNCADFSEELKGL